MPVYSSDSNNEKAQRKFKRELDLAIHKINNDDDRRDQVNAAKMAKRMKKEVRRQQRDAG